LSEHKYNTIYDRLVGEVGSEPSLDGLVAYGLYKQAKREWAANIRKTKGRSPNDAELDSYVETWTESQLQGALQQARQIIAAFADDVVNSQRPFIERDALKGKFWTGVGQSIVGAFSYSIILIGIFAIISFFGIDLLTILSADQ
jgi:hypothetical protein